MSGKCNYWGMSDRENVSKTVSCSEEFLETVVEAYPGARSAAEAIVMAAQDGVHMRSSYGSCFEDRVRSIVNDELDQRDLD